jgi:hypothetical protein
MTSVYSPVRSHIRANAKSQFRTTDASSDAWVLSGATLDLDFANQRYFQQGVGTSIGSLITCTRSSVGYIDDLSGNLVSVPANSPRISNKGLLIEVASTNLYTQSQTFSTGGGTMTLVANNATAPDGTITAAKLTVDTNNAEHTWDFSFLPAGSTTYTFSCFLKAGTQRYVQIQFRVSGDWTTGNTVAGADLQTGTLNLNTNLTGTIKAYANGWYRVTIAATSVASPGTSGVYRLQPASNADGITTIYQGDGTSYFYAWGAQLEALAFATSYIPTTTTSATRAADLITVTTAPGTGSWFNQNSGSLIAWGKWSGVLPTPASYAPGLVQIDNTSSSRTLLFIGSATSNMTAWYIAGGVNYFAKGLGTAVLNTLEKLAITWDATNGYSAAANGGTVQTGAVGTIETGFNRMTLGYAGSNNAYLCGYLTGSYKASPPSLTYHLRNSARSSRSKMFSAGFCAGS